MTTETSPHQPIVHHSQLNVFVNLKVFTTTATGVEVHTSKGKLLQRIPFDSITKLWMYDGLSAQDPKGDLFRVRYSRIYSSQTGPVYISNTANIGASGYRSIPAANSQDETYDLLMNEVIRQVARVHPKTRLHTGYLTVVVVCAFSLMIGLGFMSFPYFELRLGMKSPSFDWLKYVGLSVVMFGMGLGLAAFSIAHGAAYWPKSETVESVISRS